MRRQFDGSPTTSQTKFDVAVGVVLPVACFVFDPIVFKSFDGGGGFFASYQLFAYLLSAIGMTALGAWLVARERLGEWAPAAGGVMLAGALFCYAAGIVLLPFSLIGLIFLVGVFGFTPFFTGFVYLRNGARAVRLARNRLSFRTNFAGALVVGAALSFGVPALASAGVARFVDSSAEALLAGRELSGLERAALRVARNFTGARYDGIVRAYGMETDPARKARLETLYRELTGSDVRKRLVVLGD